MIHARAFELSIESDEPIPGLRAANGDMAGADAVRVYFDAWPEELRAAGHRATAWPNAAAGKLGTRETQSHLDGRWISVRFADDVRFAVRYDGREVWFLRPADISTESLATYLLGPIMGLVLRLRGTLCLHASAVLIGGRAIALTGPSESGKSTTAAALLHRGIPVLADDIVALDVDDAIRVRPAFPRIRLWPDASEALYGKDVSLDRLCEGWDKRYVDIVPSEFPQRAPLGAVYFLGPRADVGAPAIAPMGPREALVSLVANTYANRALDARMRREEFTALSALVRSVPHFRLTPHSDPARIGELCDSLVEHALNLQ